MTMFADRVSDPIHMTDHPPTQSTSAHYGAPQEISITYVIGHTLLTSIASKGYIYYTYTVFINCQQQ